MTPDFGPQPWGSTTEDTPPGASFSVNLDVSASRRQRDQTQLISEPTSERPVVVHRVELGVLDR